MLRAGGLRLKERGNGSFNRRLPDSFRADSNPCHLPTLRGPSPRAYPLRLEGSSGPSLRMNFAHRKEPPVTPAGLAHRSPTLRRI
jgi:hypothetical protein